MLLKSSRLLQNYSDLPGRTTRSYDPLDTASAKLQSGIICTFLEQVTLCKICSKPQLPAVLCYLGIIFFCITLEPSCSPASVTSTFALRRTSTTMTASISSVPSAINTTALFWMSVILSDTLMGNREITVVSVSKHPEQSYVLRRRVQTKVNI